VRAIRDDDPLVDAARSRPGPGEFAVPEALRRLIVRLKAMRPEGGSSVTEETVAGPRPSEETSAANSFADPAAPAVDDSTEEMYNFLAPPQESGELGRLGPYRVLRVLGVGGMGVVFLAEDPQLRRLVALKAMKPAIAASPVARGRFLREARATASIDHDHIVHIYQVGEDRGVPFLAMQLLKGEELDDRLRREGTLPAGEILRIGREVAEGLAVAHEAGLIHRDVKPSNIWLEAARGRVKLLDFGLARAVEGDASMTHSGTILGTPAYMAPEQAKGEALDARCDLFSLGVVLYLACTGTNPFRGPSAMSVLLSVTRDVPPPPRDVDPEVPPALSDLVMRLLNKDPDGRPASAREVAEALRAIEQVLVPGPSPHVAVAAEAGPWRDLVLADEPRGTPPARRPGWPTLAGLGALATVILLGIVFRVQTPKGTLEIIAEAPDAKVIVAKDGREITIDVGRGQSVRLDAGTYRVRLGDGPADLALSTDTFRLERDGKTVVTIRRVPEPPGEAEFRPKGPSADLAILPPPTPLLVNPFDALRREDIPPYELAAAGGGDPNNAPSELVAVLGDSRLRHWRPVTSVAYSPDGKTVASASEDFTITLWDPATGKASRTLQGNQGQVYAVAFSPDGRTLASTGFDQTVRLWDVATGRTRRVLKSHTKRVLAVAFSPDGKTLASGGDDKIVKVWDPQTGEQLQSFEGHTGPIYAVAFRPDGKTLASGGMDGAVKLWDVAAGKVGRTFDGHKAWVRTVAFSPDGATLASAAVDGTVSLWDPDTGEGRRTLQNRFAVYSVAFSPDGQALVTGGAQLPVRLWDVSRGDVLRSFEGSRHIVYSVAFSPDGKSLASGGVDGSVRLWDVSIGREEQPLSRGHQGSVISVAASPDGRTLASGGDDSLIKLWELGSGEERTTIKAATADVYSLSFGPDGRTLASGSKDSTMRLWDAATRAQIRSLEHKGQVLSVAFSPDGKTVASGIGYTANFTIHLWDAVTGRQRYALSGHKSHVHAVAFSPNGKTLASGSVDATVKLWDVASGEERRTLKPGSALQAVAFSPDGRILATPGSGHALKFWDVDTGQELRSLPGHGDFVQSLAFSPDGRVLASAADDATVRLWDPLTGTERKALRLGPPGARASYLAFSPDGQHLATANADGTLYVLRLGIPAGRAPGSVMAQPAPPVTRARPAAPPASPLDRLDPALIPAEDRFDWQPEELVAVLGEHRQRHGDLVVNVAYSPDGQWVASWGEDVRVSLWEAATMRRRVVLPGRGLAFSPDSKSLAAGSTLYDLTAAGPEPRATLKEMMPWRMAFSPDGKTLAVGHRDATVRLWDLGAAEPRERAVLRARAVSMTSVAISPDGKTLATGEAPGTVRLWDL